MRYYIADILVPLSVIMAMVLAIAGTIIGIAYTGNRIECSAFSSATGIATKFAGLDCYVEVEGKFIPMTQYKTAFERNLNIKVTP